MTMVPIDATEFIDLDVSAIALVGKQANGFAFSPFVAKALEEIVDAVKEEYVSYCGDTTCGLCAHAASKGKLKAKERNALPDSDFALPGRRYPIHDISHARNALSRVSENGTPEEKEKVRAAVHRRYPEIGESEEASKMTASIDESLSQTREVEGKQGPVSIDPSSDMPSGEPHVAFPPDVDNQERFFAPSSPKAAGTGDNAVNTHQLKGDPVPKAEALSQTNEVTRKESVPSQGGEVDGSGDKAPDGAGEAARAKGEAETQTDEVTRKSGYVTMDGSPAAAAGGSEADASPGSSAWEAKDAALADLAGQLLCHAQDLIKMLGNRERAEKRSFALTASEGALRSAKQAIEDLLRGIPTTNITTDVSKEIEDMPTEELQAAIKEALAEDRKARRQVKKEKAAKAKMKKMEKKLRKAEAGDGDEDDAQKAADAAGPVRLSKKAMKGLAQMAVEFPSLRESVERIAAQPVRATPLLNESGLRGGLPGAPSDPAFKELEEAVQKAVTPAARARAQQKLDTAKMFNAEAHRPPARPGEGVPIFATTDPTGRLQ